MTPPDHPLLFALDLDGTLLDGAGRVSPRAVAALTSVVAVGHRVVIATGRPPDLAIRAAPELVGLVSHVVGGNGTIISTFPADAGDTADLVHVSGFDLAAAIEIVGELRRCDDGFGFALATERGFAHEPGFVERMPAAVHDDPIDDALSIGGTTAFKLLVFHLQRSVTELLVDVPPLIAHLGHAFSVRHMGADAVEIGPARDDKGAGLRWLCDHLGVASSHVVAVGDELNDLTMLEWAGWGVAVANGDDRVRAAADEVIGSNLDDGVAVFMERFDGTPHRRHRSSR